MPTLRIDYKDDETTPDRVAAKASELGITSEQLIKRAIDQYLGECGLTDPPEGFKAQGLSNLFEAHGLLKPKN